MKFNQDVLNAHAEFGGDLVQMQVRYDAQDWAIEFMNEAATYFENRATGGEDKAFWSNVYNAENCRRVAGLLSALSKGVAA